MTTLTLLTAHPLEDSLTQALAHAWARGAERAGATVEAFDVTKLAFDPVLRAAYRTPMVEEADLARVRQSLDRAAHVAWFFPVWWAGLPAAMKGLVDRLFLPKRSFTWEGGLPKGLLAGRSSHYVATMDSPAAWYYLAQHDPLGGSFGRGTLRYVGFGPVTRTLLFSVRTATEARRKAWLQRLEVFGERQAQRALRLGQQVARPGPSTGGAV
jgi:putative NADPH-quinone reductase